MSQHINPEVANLMQQANGEFQTSEKNLGYGLVGERPPAGKFTAHVSGLEMGTAERDVEITTGAKTKMKVITLQFSYGWAKDPSQPSDLTHCKGALIDILPNFSSHIKERKKQIRWRINMEKAAGALFVLTGVEPAQASLMDQVSLVQAHFNAGNTYTVQAVASVRKYKDKDGTDKEAWEDVFQAKLSD